MKKKSILSSILYLICLFMLSPLCVFAEGDGAAKGHGALEKIGRAHV